jgi:hypothetical protein
MKRKKDSEYEEINMLIENDTDRAVASILGQYNLAKANLDGKCHPEKASSRSICRDTPKSSDTPDVNNETNIVVSHALQPTKSTEAAPGN